jgi:hypothetical protein
MLACGSAIDVRAIRCCSVVGGRLDSEHAPDESRRHRPAHEDADRHIQGEARAARKGHYEKVHASRLVAAHQRQLRPLNNNRMPSTDCGYA